MLTRRNLIAAAALSVPLPSLAAARPVVSILGDSITAGFGLPASAAFPARLQAELGRLGKTATIRPAGVSGDTTAGGLARVDFSVQRDTRLCIVALGGNDLLRGLKPSATRANLEAIVRRLKARKIKVLLAGLTAPPAIGGGYAREFNAVFPAVAKAQGVAFYPNLLAGVAGLTKLNQRDGIHPNAQGAALIAQRLAPVVARALT
ncbi:arylesterase [Phenylobacterium sp.]|uniref:arylesterase n=1 Tax=Phenylobacterium sp. TaxID=1871053 RepID=UPI002724A87C|nr:arylesterase [Phenylobacterium sp.]MDO8379320.1 arylesterase [Phenylobacterium sp.]